MDREDPEEIDVKKYNIEDYELDVEESTPRKKEVLPNVKRGADLFLTTNSFLSKSHMIIQSPNSLVSKGSKKSIRSEKDKNESPSLKIDSKK